MLRIRCGEEVERSALIDLRGQLRGRTITEDHLYAGFRLERTAHLPKYVNEIGGGSDG